MLQASGVTKRFGGLVAVDAVDMEVEEGEFVGLIGPNGAGKSTLFHLITGLYTPDAGTITFEGRDITGEKPHRIAQMGIGRTFQTPRTFDHATVIENVLVGSVFGNGSSIDDGRISAREFLEFAGMAERADVEVSSLNLLEKKQVELVRALTTNPKLLLIDEIGSGLTPAELRDLTETLERIRSELGIAIIWIEHIMQALMGAVDRVVVLNQGEMIADGTPSTIQEDEHVLEAYLGGTA